VVVTVAPIRMSNFVVGLTNTNPSVTAPVYKQYNYVQYDGELAAGKTGSVSFAALGTYQYVIIQQHFTGTNMICVSEVKVFERGRPR